MPLIIISDPFVVLIFIVMDTERTLSSAYDMNVGEEAKVLKMEALWLDCLGFLGINLFWG